MTVLYFHFYMSFTLRFFAKKIKLTMQLFREMILNKVFSVIGVLSKLLEASTLAFWMHFLKPLNLCNYFSLESGACEWSCTLLPCFVNVGYLGCYFFYRHRQQKNLHIRHIFYSSCVWLRSLFVNCAFVLPFQWLRIWRSRYHQLICFHSFTLFFASWQGFLAFWLLRLLLHYEHKLKISVYGNI